MNLVYIYQVRYTDMRFTRVGTESRVNVEGGTGFVEGGEGEAEGEDERADVSEVIEATGHPGRKSHESRASGCEQCRAALLVRLLPPLPRHLAAVPSSFASSSSPSSLEDHSSLPPFSNVRLCVP